VNLLKAHQRYMNAVHAPQPRQLVMPIDEDKRKGSPLRVFTEWDSQADAAYDCLR